MSGLEELSQVTVEARLLAAARNAVNVCLSTTEDDNVVVIYDETTLEIAAALTLAFLEIVPSLQCFNIDTLGVRPHTVPPRVVLGALSNASVSTLAVAPLQGEFSVRRAILETVTKYGLRHAHMPSITIPVFIDALSVDYDEVSRFIGRLVDLLRASTSLEMTSEAGTDIEFSYPAPAPITMLDGLIKKDRWQNIPSGQVVIAPSDANGIYVIDESIGDWFESKYDVWKYPVTMEFHRGHVRSIRCDNKRLERDLWVLIHSSANAGRISELVIGANLGLTQGHTGALYQGYRPGASISIGESMALDPQLKWTAATFVPLIGKRTSLIVGEKQIMTGDLFTSF